MKFETHGKWTISAAVAAAAFSLSNPASAQYGQEFYLETGTNTLDTQRFVPGNADLCGGGGNCGTGGTAERTEEHQRFDITFLRATSIYERANSTGGALTGLFYDTNINVGGLDDICLPDGTGGAATCIPQAGATTRNGGTEDLLAVATPPIAVGDQTISLPSVSPPGIVSGDNEGYGESWHINTQYTFVGNLGGPGGLPQYTDGLLQFIAARDDGAADGTVAHNTVVAEWDVTFSEIAVIPGGTGAVLNIYFSLKDAVAGLFFLDDKDISAFGTDTTGDDTSVVQGRINVTITPAIPTDSELVDMCDSSAPASTGFTAVGAGGDCDAGQYAVAVRQSDLDGSFRMTFIPEPGTVALFSLGLLGLASRSRKKLS